MTTSLVFTVLLSTQEGVSLTHSTTSAKIVAANYTTATLHATAEVWKQAQQPEIQLENLDEWHLKFWRLESFLCMFSFLNICHFTEYVIKAEEEEVKMSVQDEEKPGN